MKIMDKTIGRKIIIANLAFVLVSVLIMLAVQAQASSTQYYPPSPLSYYSSSIDTYWPAYGKENCLARQDFIVQILPGACSPAVLRTDLLEEQDVPVFCQLTGIKINPLIEVPEITSISFKGQLQKDIAGIGFHPARAALKTWGSTLLGSPVLNNLGYLVVVVRRQPAENATPDWVEANLTALIQYNAEKALGIGRAGFSLPVLNDDEWRQYYKQYSFWNGKAYIRALEIGKDSAGDYTRIAIYLDANKQLTSFILHSGQTSQEIYLPGYYCSAALKASIQKIASPEIKAKVRVGDDQIWLTKGQRFLDDNCWVKDIQPNIVGGGKIAISCKDSGPYTLEIDPPTARITVQDSAKHEIASDDFKVGQALVEKKIYLGYIGSTDNAISTELRKSSQDFIVLVNPQEAFDQEYFNNLNIIVNSILKGKKYSLFKLIESVVKSLNKKADKSVIKFGEAVGCLSGCDNSLENGLVEYFGDKAKQQFHIIASGGGTGQGTSVWGYHFTFEKVIGSLEKNYASEESGFGKLLENYFKKAEDAYKKVADYYGSEKKLEGQGEPYGAEALHEAAKLAGELKKFKTQEELLNRIIKDYPDSGIAETAEYELGLIRIQDRSKASSYINTAGTTYYTILEDIAEPGLEDKSADLFVDGKTETYAENQIIKGSITLSTITDEWVKFSYQNKDGNVLTSREIRQGDPVTIPIYENGKEEKVSIRVSKINLKKEASVVLEPSIMQAQTQTNFTFKIGIEKRAIKLSPEKTQELINELNTSIAQWETVVNNLGNLIKTWKGTCFAGSAYLVVKNFFANLGGGAGLARTEAMKYWKTVCKGEIAEAKKQGQSMTFHQCYMNHATEIDSSVGTIKGIYESTNKEIEEIKKKPNVLQKYPGSLGIFNEQYLNESACIAVSQEYLNKYDAEFKSGDDSFKSSDIFSKDNLEMLRENSRIYCNDVKDILSNIKLQQECTTGTLKSATAFCKQLSTTLYTDMKQWKTTTDELQKTQKVLSQTASNDKDFFNLPALDLGKTVRIEQLVKKETRDKLYIANEPIQGAGWIEGIKGKNYAIMPTSIGNLYVLLKQSGTEWVPESKDSIYNFIGSDENKVSVTPLTEEQKVKLKETSIIVKAREIGFGISNPYNNKEVKFWESGPYKGLPAVLPLGKYADQGWYVATEPYSLGTQGTKAYTEAAQPISYWICNVNGNNLEEWETAGHGDDNPCIWFSMQTGMSESTYKDIPNSADMIKLARQYLLEASRQYGKKGYISVGNKQFPVGKPAVTIPQYECEDFMSPSDCHLMFNLCDPVLCPSSRCDYGGRYPVADVVQTGVIGSLLLCLPNAKEGILVPICLTGVHAGLDNFVQIMKATRDCLQENLKTGRNVGICDQIKSIYLCEFFWKQAAPILKVGIPWLLESISGKSHRGGGEYLFVQDAWSKAQDSVNYFTNYYGVNAFKAFQSRSIESAGTEVCKAWVSANYPSTADMFDKLLEPESPTQFYATLSEDVITEATVPSTSHYKVYFRIYAGKDEGVYYNVYLKGQPQTEYYSQLGEMQVPNAVGYIPRGEQVDRSTDFTGPSGYKELCVRINAREECGFGQVTTSFAMTELKDSYLAQQATQPITKESECIEGTSSMTAAVLNLNLQTGISEVTQPAIYKRGIIRVCSSDNPSATTEPTRWQAVGYCDNKKIICWLDTVSLNQSITDQGILTETLEKAKEMAKEIDKEGMWDKEKTDTAKQKADQNKAELINTDNTGKLDNILSKKNLQFADADKVKEDIEKAIELTIGNYSDIIRKSVFNKDKAQAQIEIASIYDKITRLIYENKVKKEEKTGKAEALSDKFKIGDVITPSELKESVKITKITETLMYGVGVASGKNYKYSDDRWKEISAEEIKKLEQEELKEAKACKLEKAGWDYEQGIPAGTVSDGEEVGLIVTGKSCGNAQVRFNIYKQRTLGQKILGDETHHFGDFGDIFFRQIESTFINEKAEAKWIVEWESENSDYYFIVTVIDSSGNEFSSKKSGAIHVIRNIIEAAKAEMIDLDSQPSQEQIVLNREKILKIGGKTYKISLESETQFATLTKEIIRISESIFIDRKLVKRFDRIEQSEQVDVDNDGTYDLEIQLKDIDKESRTSFFGFTSRIKGSEELADCGSCSRGILPCSYDKCHKIGNCYISIAGKIKAQCLNCFEGMVCSDFDNPTECNSNLCGLECELGVSGCVSLEGKDEQILIEKESEDKDASTKE